MTLGKFSFKIKSSDVMLIVSSLVHLTCKLRSTSTISVSSVDSYILLRSKTESLTMGIKPVVEEEGSYIKSTVGERG